MLSVTPLGVKGGLGSMCSIRSKRSLSLAVAGLRGRALAVTSSWRSSSIMVSSLASSGALTWAPEPAPLTEVPAASASSVSASDEEELQLLAMTGELLELSESVASSESGLSSRCLIRSISSMESLSRKAWRYYLLPFVLLNILPGLLELLMFSISLLLQLLSFLPVMPVPKPVVLLEGCVSLLVFVQESLPGGLGLN